MLWFCFVYEQPFSALCVCGRITPILVQFWQFFLHIFYFNFSNEFFTIILRAEKEKIRFYLLSKMDAQKCSMKIGIAFMFFPPFEIRLESGWICFWNSFSVWNIFESFIFRVESNQIDAIRISGVLWKTKESNCVWESVSNLCDSVKESKCKSHYTMYIFILLFCCDCQTQL